MARGAKPSDGEDRMTVGGTGPGTGKGVRSTAGNAVVFFLRPGD